MSNNSTHNIFTLVRFFLSRKATIQRIYVFMIGSNNSTQSFLKELASHNQTLLGSKNKKKSAPIYLFKNSKNSTRDSSKIAI